jgi:hypothetical protein
MRVIRSKLRANCGKYPENDAILNGAIRAVEEEALRACRPLSLIFEFVKENNPSAAPESWYEATYDLRSYIKCDDETLARLEVFTSYQPAPAAQAPKPDCNDFDAIVADMWRTAQENHIGQGMSQDMTMQAVLLAARRYQVDHGCRAPAPAPLPTTTTDCEPSAFHDGSFSCTTH